MLKKCIVGLFSTVMLSALLLTGCSDESYMATVKTEKESSEEISVAESSSKENETEIEEETSKVENGEETESESGTMLLEEEEGKTFIYSVTGKEYDIQEIVDYLLGDETEVTNGTDSMNGEKLDKYTADEGTFYSGNDCQFTFENGSAASRYMMSAASMVDPSFSFLPAHLLNLFPVSPETAPEYAKVKEICDQLACLTGFPYDIEEVYYMDDGYINDMELGYFQSGGPECYVENRKREEGDKLEPYWRDDENAFFFIYRMTSFGGKKIGTYYDENFLLIVYSPCYGICYVSAPMIPEYNGIHEEADIISEGEALQEFMIRIAGDGIYQEDIEVVSSELVHSVYNVENCSFKERELLPYWDVTFRSLIPDKELEEKMTYTEIFRGEEGSEWHLLIPAVRR